MWLSVMASFFYVLESVLCLFPRMVSEILSYDNSLFQALLNICYPFSQLFVGKRVHVNQVIKKILK